MRNHYYSNGQIKVRVFETPNGTAHNIDGPARQTWYENGQLASEEYIIHGKKHNENGPAVQEWWESGQLKLRYYLINGKLHNLFFPAVQEWNKNGRLISILFWFDDLAYNSLEEMERAIKLNCLK